MLKDKVKKPAQKELRILSKPPAIASDGNSLTLNTENMGDLLFFQIAEKKEDTLEVNGVSNVRMTLKQLKALNGLLTMAIADHEKKMASKGLKAKDLP